MQQPGLPPAEVHGVGDRLPSDYRHSPALVSTGGGGGMRRALAHYSAACHDELQTSFVLRDAYSLCGGFFSCHGRSIPPCPQRRTSAPYRRVTRDVGCVERYGFAEWLTVRYCRPSPVGRPDALARAH